MTCLLAELTNAESAWLLTGFGVAAALAVTANQVLGALNGWQKRFGRKPSADDDLRTQQQALEHLKLELKDLAPSDKVDALLERLATFITRQDLDDARDEIRAIELLLPTFITRSELDVRMERTEKYQSQWFHRIGDELQAIRSTSEAQREGLHNRVNVLSEVLFELRGALRNKPPEMPR